MAPEAPLLHERGLFDRGRAERCVRAVLRGQILRHGEGLVDHEVAIDEGRVLLVRVDGERGHAHLVRELDAEPARRQPQQSVMSVVSPVQSRASGNGQQQTAELLSIAAVGLQR